MRRGAMVHHYQVLSNLPAWEKAVTSHRTPQLSADDAERLPRVIKKKAALALAGRLKSGRG